MEDATLIKLQPPLIPRGVEGPGAGRSLRVEYTGAVIIGRHQECGFFLEEEIKAASRLDTANDTVQKWLLRAEKELDELIDKHYRQGLLAYKYMRHDEARSEFNLVVQWSGSQDDKRYKDARQKLDELEEKR